MTQAKQPQVAILMGSDSDWPTMKAAADALDMFGVTYEKKILSAHRTPNEVAEYGRLAADREFRVIIAGAGGAAHLPGMLAAYTPLPVIGVPVPLGHLQGEDALLSIVQMPRGVPVAAVAIGNAWNAAILAIQIIAHGGQTQDRSLCAKLARYKEEMRTEVLDKRL